MSRKRILGKIELKFIKKNNDSGFTIEIGGQCSDVNYFNNIELIRECITKELGKLSQLSKGGEK